MSVIELLFLIVIFSVVIAAMAAVVEPKGTAKQDLRAFNRGWFKTAVLGVVGTVGGSFFFLRHGTDGGWWPVAAVIYSSAWVVLVAVVGAAVRWMRVKRASIVRYGGPSNHG